ncbi:Hypothetical protein SRAE_2000371900 [Strongyloides ratti]|uniref:Uncharacterized protein n=1 Tax=Strongyloides ratti TaxID=34506 RepID=A0A090LH10_STRRB|nr:Hypothetical protein SRAE_2000371900 [Strongyloides ratti]CEF69067.1 Hypothetical protein SRAE_2000371900 [Strongyloides ratti]
MNGTNELNILFDQLKIKTPQKSPFLSPPTSDLKTFASNSHLNFSNNSTPTSSAATSNATTPGTPEAVRIHGGRSPVPFELMNRILSLIKDKKANDGEQRNIREIEHRRKRLNQVTMQRSRTIKNPIIKKFLQQKKE